MKVRFEEATKLFGSVVAVDHLNLEINDGELLVLLGPSGCGKTTSLRMLAGLESISDGRIYIGERCVNEVPPRHRDIAMVFQNYALYPHMTVRQNIGYPLLIRRKNREEIEREVRRVAGMLEIETLLERRPRELSGGQRQRVALARAIVRQPAAFLMDEPLSNLDARLRLEMRGELKRLQREMATTTVYVTHDQAEAMTLADRIAIMQTGKLQQVGTPMELYRRPVNRFVAGFLGSPPMNFLSGSIKGDRFLFDGGEMELSAQHMQAASRAEKVIAGFRPEAASLRAPDDGQGLVGKVYITEQLGNESFVILEVGSARITVRAQPDFAAEIGNPLKVEIPKSAIHLFDAGTDAALS